MGKFAPLSVVLGLFSVALAGAEEVPATTGKVDFARQIRPLLQAKCLRCHGPETQESQLRLDRRSSLLRGGDSGEPALVPGRAEQSHLIQLVSGRQAGQWMPPDERERLTPEQINLLRAWIDQGAAWDDTDEPAGDEPAVSNHWAFQPVGRPVPPGSDDPWIRNGIDAFILAGLRQHGLAPNPPAGRAELIRRIYLDMLGLPPTPEEVQAYVADPNPEATTALIERVLRSPHYGERWARYWLDLVRFAETNGFETNRERPHAWPYRDYVIRALNEDRPYDQFLREQLAGDSLGVPAATAYLVAGPYDLVKSPDINLTLMQRQNELDDIISTTGTALLGLTLGCARCHNHKFDPVRQTDYYALQAIFAGVQHGERTLPLTAPQQDELRRLDERLAALRTSLQPFLPERGARPSVTARGNEDTFEPTRAKFIRFTILATNSGEPCLDELEIFSGATNVALATAGAKATCSSSLPGYAIHQLPHIHDGRYGNSRSWISHEPGKGWVQIELPQEMSIQRVVWARDREGQFADRVATQYRIEVAVEPDRWQQVASSADRQPFSGGTPAPPAYDFTTAPPAQAAQGKRWLAELQAVEQERKALQESAQVYCGTFQQPGPTYRLFRGEPQAKREQVGPNTVAALGKLELREDSPEPQRRLALAQWITSPDNPLTPRVIVNRWWQFHFGKGLVATPSDLGAAGVPPTHPELLDWLARELLDHGWSLKHIHRLILQSATYQQSSRPRAEALQADAATDWWWRFPPRRLEAEPIRDSVLAVAGTLDTRLYGPGFSGFEVELENVRHYFPKKAYGPADWRRMIYMTKVRLEKESVFGIFDCPDAATSVPRRSRSTTPLQAFNLFNSEFMLQQSERLAARLERECGNDAGARVTRAFWLCYGRAPEADERAESLEFAAAEGWPALTRALLNSNEFVFLQ
ncbi:MAG: DUF1553 domain-containing protein [Pirellulales bacterium]